eukprot:CAMPEP_0197174272 /NCGR_PEP_ID=MMETSP1423-20130617/868_1 /TAXON_ID=476441 /ORGANISM="Pseudo-nitzschia heimii, Strain UNC1101" /LENGTH=758 /DNA_ID=CAMNT_0042623183 /DNA_START=117 /DNA_END=2393 /DNA_ORIENTATION=-
MARCLDTHSYSRKLASSLLFLFLALSTRCIDGRVTTGGNDPISRTSGERNLAELDEERQEQVVRPYKIWEASEFSAAMLAWEEKWPDLIKVTTAQEAYGLPTAGDESDCPYYAGKGCPNYFFTIQDFVAHPVGSDSSSHLPEVFLSGEVHGDEQVGPTSVMEASLLLLEAAHCEALPRGSGSTEKEPLKEARDCRKDLLDKGIDEVDRKWLARLVATRRIVVAPTANALGYYRKQRTEGPNDPNRDFPYDYQARDSDKCMRTIAARTINEIYREHMFQLAFTFHGGMEVLAYEWGAPSWLDHFSPDHEAQFQLGGAYSQYGGGFSSSKPYDYGTMNEKVYFVRGGMEDWAYAGSWTPEIVLPCTPKEFGGYPKEKTIYNNSTLRVFNMLVEASNVKSPTKALGTSLDILSHDTTGNGHISRNIRLSLMAVDMVEPYVGIVGVNKMALTDDIVPLSERNSNNCIDTKAVLVASNAENVDIEWTVGGALTIDSTELWYGKWDDVSDDIKCWSQPSDTKDLKRVGPTFSGTGFFSGEGSEPNPEDTSSGMKKTSGPLFRTSVPLTGFQKGDKILVMASARVDQSWKDQPENILPNLPPQSHIVNARTDRNYHHESNGKVIQGRVDWFSVPLTVVIGDFEDSVGTRAEDSVDVVEKYSRFVGKHAFDTAGVKPKSSETDQLWFPVALWQYLVGFLLFGTLFFCCIRCSPLESNSRVKMKQGDSFDEYEDDNSSLELRGFSDRVDDEYGEEESDDGLEIPRIS